MIKFFFAFLILVFPVFSMAQENAPSANASSAAQAPVSAPKFAPLKLELYPNSTLIVDPADPKAVKTQKDFVNAFAQNCIQSNNSKTLEEYKNLQCACTAAEMSQTMNESELNTMFQDSKEGDFEYARMMLLSYIPCLGQTVKKFIFDSCIGDKNIQARISNPHGLCSCVSDQMSTYTKEEGAVIIPGFTRSGFKKSQAVNDTFGFVITSPGFELQSNSAMRKCIKLNETKK